LVVSVPQSGRVLSETYDGGESVRALLVLGVGCMFDFFDGTNRLIRFRGSFSIAMCARLKRELEQAVEGVANPSGDWTFDFEEVEGLDFASLQLLLFFKRHVEGLGGTVSLVNQPRLFSDTVGLFGLQREFGLE
jgi:hypothetical protein